MTKMRLDPSFVEDERWERLGGDALLLHLHAVAYAVRTLADGALTMGRVCTLTPLVNNPRRVAQQLLDDGLWTALPDGKVQVCVVHDDLRRADGRGDEQPSRCFVDKERARQQRQKEAWRAQRRKEQEAREQTSKPEENDPWNVGRNADGNAVRNAAQHSAVQSSAVQDPSGPGPGPAAGGAAMPGPGTECNHGHPYGRLTTTAGTSRCLDCRTEQSTSTSQEAS